MKHVVIFSDEAIERLLSGKLKFSVHFFKKKPDFLKQLSIGDIIFFRESRKEILGQFEVGKLIVIEELEIGDWGLVEQLIGENLKEAKFQELVDKNSTLIIIQIKNLEQLITSPIEVSKSKKEWVVLD